MLNKFKMFFTAFFLRNGKISTRFRKANILLFLIVSVVISIVMLFVLRNITDTVAKDYAELYSSNTAGIFSTHFGNQISLLKKAAHSNAVIEWFADEDNQEKKRVAYEEMMEIISLLPSKNLYIGIEKSLHEFTVEENFTIDDIQPFATLQPDYYDDEWYFECVGSDMDYILNVDIDKILQRKRVWLNYKVTRGEEVLGVICTWLEFYDLVEELSSKYDRENVRGLIIDENGIINMDSSFLGNDNYLYYTIDNEKHINEEFSDNTLISAVDEYLKDIDGYFNLSSDTAVIELTDGKYRYVTIVPITSTTWSVVTFYNSSSLFSITELMPLVIIFFAMFIIFTIATGFASNKLIFEPFEKLTRSIAHIKSNYNELIYGIERRDEIGDIANTVQNMKESLIDALEKVHYDALTGIYNRRFLEENLGRIIKSLSRSGGILSVIMIDVDFFKRYNDTYGHDMGDACLKTIANTLVNSIERTNDFAARYGGEEFAVILPHTDKNGACIIAERMLENVRLCNIPHETNDAADRVTISIGVTTGNVMHPQSGENYIKLADKALYISKRRSRNTYTFLDFEMTDK